MNPNVLPRQFVPGLVLSLGVVTLSGCAAQGHAETQPTKCYEANIAGPALPSLRNDLKHNGMTPTSLDGVVDTAYAINDKLTAMHHKYRSIIPGDKFSYCITGKKVTPGSVFEVAE